MDDSDRLAAAMVCVGVAGTTIDQHAREMLARGVRSVILFTRNYESPAQLLSCAPTFAPPHRTRS